MDVEKQQGASPLANGSSDDGQDSTASGLERHTETQHPSSNDERGLNAQEKRLDNETQHASIEPSKPVGPGPPPNGGLTAWLHVLGSFMLFFNTWGLLNTFGVFQTYYESGELFTSSSSDISWIGSIQSYTLLLTGVFSGPIYDKGYLTPLLIVGSFGIVFGQMMLSICNSYWQVLLAQGFCIGIGGGCLFIPSVAILPTYFNTRLGLAVGVAASGSSMGGIIYPIMLYKLIDQVGFGWSVRIMGFVSLATLIIPIAIMKMRVKPPKTRALVDWSAFTDIPYMSFVVSALIGFIGLYVMLFYLSYYALDKQITDTSMAFYLVAIFNAGSCFGRTIPNAISDKTGPLNLLVPCSMIYGVLVFCMLAVKNTAGIVIVALLAGFFSGVFIALPPVCFVILTKDKSKIGSRIGMGFAMVGLGVLVGGPGGGRILGTVDPLNWTGLWVFGGVTTCVASLGFAILRVAKFGFKLNVKA